MSRIDDLWEGQGEEPCPRCRDVCTYCIVSLRERQPSHPLTIVAENDGGDTSVLHICDVHKRRIMAPAP